MLKGKVVGNFVSTYKFKALEGFKLLEIRLIENNQLTDKYVIALDRDINAGIGEEVIVVKGSSARVAVGDANAPVDAVVAGIVDKLQN